MLFQVQASKSKPAEFQDKELAESRARQAVPQKSEDISLDPKSVQGRKVLADLMAIVDNFNLTYANHVHNKDLRPISIPIPDSTQ